MGPEMIVILGLGVVVFIVGKAVEAAVRRQGGARETGLPRAGRGSGAPTGPLQMCGACMGTGRGLSCSACNGNGNVTSWAMGASDMTVQRCMTCAGSGRAPCALCGGGGRTAA